MTKVRRWDCPMRFGTGSTRSPGRRLPTPGTATGGTCRSWKCGASTGTWRRGVRAGGRWAGTRGSTRRRIAWSKSRPRPRAGSGTRNANGRPRHPTAGSRRSSASGGPACGARPRRGGMEPGMSGAGHQAAAGAPGSVRAPVRRWNIARITRIGGSAGSSGPFRVPCRSLRTSGVLTLVSAPASLPARSSVHVPELTFYGAGS